MCNLQTFVRVACHGLEVTLKVRDAILVRIDDLTAQGAELGRYNLDEVLEHVLRLRRLIPHMFFSLCSSTQDEQKPPHPRHMLIQRVPVYTQALAHLFADLCVGLVRLVIRGEVHVVDRVRKVVAVAVVLQVRHELVKPRLRRLEGASGRELDVPDDLVHPQDAGNVATFRRLLLDVFGPVFLNALRSHTHQNPAAVRDDETRWGERDSRTCWMPPGLPKLHPFRVYDSRTSSHELQHPFSGGSPP